MQERATSSSSQSGASAPDCVIAVPDGAHFRCVLAPLARSGDEATVSAAVLEALAIEEGGTVRAVPCDVSARDADWHQGEVIA